MCAMEIRNASRDVMMGVNKASLVTLERISMVIILNICDFLGCYIIRIIDVAVFVMVKLV